MIDTPQVEALHKQVDVLRRLTPQVTDMALEVQVLRAAVAMQDAVMSLQILQKSVFTEVLAASEGGGGKEPTWRAVRLNFYADDDTRRVLGLNLDDQTLPEWADIVTGRYVRNASVAVAGLITALREHIYSGHAGGQDRRGVKPL